METYQDRFRTIKHNPWRLEMSEGDIVRSASASESLIRSLVADELEILGLRAFEWVETGA